MASGTNVVCKKERCWFLYEREVLLVSLCNVAAVATAAYSTSAETSGAVTAGAEMSQRREVPAPKRWAPRRWRPNGGAQTAAPKFPAPNYIGDHITGEVFTVELVDKMIWGMKRSKAAALDSIMAEHIIHWVQKACKCKNFTFWLFTRFGIFRLWRTLWCRNYVDIWLTFRVICC